MDPATAERGAARRTLLAGALSFVCALVLLAPPAARGALSTYDSGPFLPSKVIVGARWTSPRYGPPSGQRGDILPTAWGADGNEYTVMNDGGTDVPVAGGIWRQSLAQITGTPPRIQFHYVGNPSSPVAHTYAQIHANPAVWVGPLGPYYTSGLVEADHTLFATQEEDWNWNANGPFQGLAGLAYSLDNGSHWISPGKHFPAPLGNLSWVQRGRGGFYPDGYVYALATEREFNASRLIMGRARPDIADLTDPSKWQWLSGWTERSGTPWPLFSASFASAFPIIVWSSHITYPQLTYDSPIRRYLLTFTYSYGSSPPAIWQDGAELVILEAPHPWGPFSFVADEPDFGPSNGYAPGIPVSWISRNGQTLWLKWSANFDGCESGLGCSGAYGFNYRRLQLTLAGGR